MQGPRVAGERAPGAWVGSEERVQAAGAMLAERRRHGVSGPRLPEGLRPGDLWHALAIQSAVAQHMHDAVAGWKCGTPGPDKLVIAPMFASTVHGQSPCPVWARAEQGQPSVKIEPELAYVLGTDLPPRAQPYSPEEMDAAIAATHLALELIDSRYEASEVLTFADKLADGLVNQGLFLGPRVDEAAVPDPGALTVEVRTEGAVLRCEEGRHPDGAPRVPLYWLAEHLRVHGEGLRAGQVVITGSYAGSFFVPVGPSLTVRFGGLGELVVRFTARERLTQGN